MPQLQQTKAQIIHDVCQQLLRSPLDASSEALIAFTQTFYDTLSLEDLSSRSILDLCGSILFVWRCIQQKKGNIPSIHIHNPVFERDGWSSKYTVVAVCQTDMPFLVDSITMAINRLGILVNFVIHSGCFHFLCNSEKNNEKVEAVLYFEIDYLNDEKAQKNLKEDITRVLRDVALTVANWKNMRERTQASIIDLQKMSGILEHEELTESIDFLQWLLKDNFTFLGSRDYRFLIHDNNQVVDFIPGSGIGVLNEKKSTSIKNLDDFPPRVREMMLSQQIILIAKTNTISTVHRPAYTDYIGIKQFNAENEVVGYRLFIGLYTSAAYHSNPQHIPFLRKKLSHILTLSKLPKNSHSGKALISILETLPRDDLFQASEAELFTLSMNILYLKERQCTRLFVRKDAHNRYFSCLVYIPKERYDTDFLQSIENILMTELQGKESTFTTLFTESVLARIHYVIRVDAAIEHVYDAEDIEKKVIAAAVSWQDALKNNLISTYGEILGRKYFLQYKSAFSLGYREEYTAPAAIIDIEYIEKLNETHKLEMSFYKSMTHSSKTVQMKLYRAHEPSPLSYVLPILENMGLKVIGEAPYALHFEEGQTIWINDFQMEPVESEQINVDEIRDIFRDAFPRIWFSEAENDRFNRLILAAQLSWKETALLRAYARYLKQIDFTFSQDYIAETLYHNPRVARHLVSLFFARFNPHASAERDVTTRLLLDKIEQDLSSVTSLDEDRILRRYLELILATLRTNYFQATQDDIQMNSFSFKLSPANISGMPLPKPLFEIFVYSPRVEGVHLRCAKVARGGIRWSDRREDFRTEVLGLMKAQQVKNAVIVPLGAKGGFIPKQLPLDGNREAITQEAICCYQIFIKGLLCLTDNIIEGKIVYPELVVRYDDDDPYLVVAADKGTATFSDIANAISLEKNFWLGDAFASGGSAGYDHKKMGITAKGAWESAKRHFRELSNTNIQATPFTVIGVGDMSGDVFGNGMLLSRHICLVAAFNHMHIFLDPIPDPEKSFMERERLFQLPRSSWEDYDRSLLSSGGAIFNRYEKSLKISQEIQNLLGVTQEQMAPNDLIKAIFRAKVDMFWNGGIGTFVKAEAETDLMVGDRTNDGIRVNAHELGCKIVVEGGNLGLTQQARVEYARHGGLINTDFIDNSAGVDCSDHEVNLKILLNQVMVNGDLTLKQRNKLLADMTAEVAELVLSDNYLQTETLSIETYTSLQTSDLFHRYLLNLEKRGRINRKIEGLPSDEEIMERKIAGKGFSRPEIAVLLAYDKILLKQQILASELPEDPYFFTMLATAFPKRISKKYSQELLQHGLRREIIATQLSSSIGNAMGINFVQRLKIETGATIASIVRAYVATYHLLGVPKLWAKIRSLDCHIEAQQQFEMMLQVYYLVRRCTRWFLRNYSVDFDILAVVDTFEKPLKELKARVVEFLPENCKNFFKQQLLNYHEKEVPAELAKEIALTHYLFTALDVLQVAQELSRPVGEVAEVYALLGQRLELNSLREKMMQYKLESQWDELSRASLLDDMDYNQRLLTSNILLYPAAGETLAAAFGRWQQDYRVPLERWDNFFNDLLTNPSTGYIMFSVMMRELHEFACKVVHYPS